MSRREAVIAANRFGLGARPGDLAEIGADPRGWLKAQLVPESHLPAPMAALPSTGEDLALLPLAILERGLARRLRHRSGDTSQAPPDVEAAVRRVIAPRIVAAANARLSVAMSTDTPFRERLVHFWSNHFVVSGVKGATVAMPPSFERDVVRPNVVGRFTTMLVDSTRHPAMQLYLDNHRNIGPNSEFGRHPERMPTIPGFDRPDGLNENLAREVLELHTVGVDARYSQDDVGALARILTGWGVTPPVERAELRRLVAAELRAGRDPEAAAASVVDELGRRVASRPWTSLAHFEPRAHEPGAFDVMGRRYGAGGREQGMRVLEDLARHRSTARFVATKLTRHFVADAPPPAVVDRVERTFLETGGDLAATAAALVDAPEAWHDDATKFRRPEEFLIATARALDLDDPAGRGFALALTEMGQPPYRAPGPDGWPDVEAHWASPAALWKRLEWASALARRHANARTKVADLAGALFDTLLSGATREAIARAASPDEALTLLLVSPEFLRR